MGSCDGCEASRHKPASRRASSIGKRMGDPPIAICAQNQMPILAKYIHLHLFSFRCLATAAQRSALNGFAREWGGRAGGLAGGAAVRFLRGCVAYECCGRAVCSYFPPRVANG